MHTTLKQRPILFSSEMVRAILDGRKTATRRVIKPEWSRCLDLDDEDDRSNALAQSPYQVGMRLWVRETWAEADDFYGAPAIVYKADDTAQLIGAHGEGENRRYELCGEGSATNPWTVEKWKPSIFMPRWASRIMLEVTDVRVEKLQSISEDDAKAEGVNECVVLPGDCGSFVAEFAYLWDALNAKRGYGWKDNPFVWVLKFRTTN